MAPLVLSLYCINDCSCSFASQARKEIQEQAEKSNQVTYDGHGENVSNENISKTSLAKQTNHCLSRSIENFGKETLKICGSNLGGSTEISGNESGFWGTG